MGGCAEMGRECSESIPVHSHPGQGSGRSWNVCYVDTDIPVTEGL